MMTQYSRRVAKEVNKPKKTKQVEVPRTREEPEISKLPDTLDMYNP